MKHPISYDSTPETRKRMSKVHLKHGKAETALAKALWHKGYRYRLNYKKLPGSPDIAITKQKVAVFVDGEFWHGYDWVHKKEKLKADRQYWIEKIEENIARDQKVDRHLHSLGWIVLRFWEKEVKKNLDSCVQTVESAILEDLLQQFALEESCAAGSGAFEPCVPCPERDLADRLNERPGKADNIC